MHVAILISFRNAGSLQATPGPMCPDKSKMGTTVLRKKNKKKNADLELIY